MYWRVDLMFFHLSFTDLYYFMTTQRVRLILLSKAFLICAQSDLLKSFLKGNNYKDFDHDD